MKSNISQPMKQIALIIALLMLSSCSCYYGGVTTVRAMPNELPIGSKVKTVSTLYGSLEEFVDDPNIHTIYISRVKMPKKRYVLEQFIIPAGTVFSVRGFTKPRNPTCFNHSLNVVLVAEKPLTTSNANAHIGVDEVLDILLFEKLPDRNAGLTNRSALDAPNRRACELKR